MAYLNCLLAQRRFDDARIMLQTATRHCPGYAQLWMEWALLEAARGNADTARQLFKKVGRL